VKKLAIVTFALFSFVTASIAQGRTKHGSPPSQKLLF
jgi:hypothetical protein